ncbi:diacylglycerol/lipid kinase family protein [Thiothrix nivea]|uniref:Diacylglycerol kinase catalytic region n=1 Tax=Thiothrix nivea (strain ATCC 35100 / DSM 5205 / JP2) TaxID=870187 RepID=A0A656HHM0_THINJ|nr:diacylglycerol kinase family protein [Thiothrix nivea]EIJ36428.1 diacylglycerol kinase catalytic region [Thiothrix nivea DSM 5205]
MSISDCKKTPVFINPESGSADNIMNLLKQDDRLEIHATSALQMADEIRKFVEAGEERILVSGGDGTLALAGGVLAGTATALGVIPGGTLNHFAGRMGIPVDPKEAVELALSGAPQAVNVAYVNDRLFINTSSVGAYVQFVRTRKHLEQRMNYHLASLLAGIRRLLRLSSARIQLDDQLIRTPLVFIGVGERELGFPSLGKNRPDGENALHLIAIRSHNPWETLKLAFNAMLRGIDPLSREGQVEHYTTDTVELYYRRKKRHIHVAVDGELTLMQSPLRYRYAKDGLRVILPA